MSPTKPSQEGRSYRVAISGDTARALRASSESAGVTLPMTLVAAFAALLCRYTGQRDLVVGVDALSIRIHVDEDAPFADLVRRVRDARLGAHAHRDAPGPDLALGFTEGPSGVEVGLARRTDRFDAAAIERMGGHYGTVLDAIAKGATGPVWALPLLSMDEIGDLVMHWSITTTDAPRCRDARIAKHLRALGMGPSESLQTYVLDGRLRPAPIGVVGELCIGGDGVAQSPAARTGTERDRLVPDHFRAVPGGRFYRTGERARWSPGGELELLGDPDDLQRETS